jgi:hypothetical protein
MWTVIVLTFIVFAIALSGMAVGVIFSNRRLRGSCGGMSGIRDNQGNTLCEVCSNPSPECRGEPIRKDCQGKDPHRQSRGGELS